MKTDSTYLQQMIHDPANQYLQEIADARPKGESDYTFDVSDAVPDSPHISETTMKHLSWVCLVIFLAVIAVLLIRMVMRQESDPDFGAAEQSLGDDTIYDHDWVNEIAGAMDSGTYGEAVVLCYLRWLEHLHDAGAIKFHQSKTPGMFIGETTEAVAQGVVSDADLQKTRTLTNQYLRVRYGHKKISAAEARQIIEL